MPTRIGHLRQQESPLRGSHARAKTQAANQNFPYSGLSATFSPKLTPANRVRRNSTLFITPVPNASGAYPPGRAWTKYY